MSLALASLRHRLTTFVGTFVALTIGVGVLSGCLTLVASLRPQVSPSYARADVLVQAPEVRSPGDSGLPAHRPWSAAETAALVHQLVTVPGVTAAIPDRPFYVQRTVSGHATGDARASLHGGRGWSAAVLGGYTIKAGAAPDGPGTAVVGRAMGLRPGESVQVVTAAGPATWRVTGITDGAGFFVDDATAMGLSGGVKVIGLRLAPGRSPAQVAGRIRLAAPGSVLTGEGRAGVQPEGNEHGRFAGAQLILALVGVGGFMAVFLVASTCALGVAQRRRDIGLLRAIGATPGQVHRMLLAEVAVLGLVAGAAGVLLGLVWPPLVQAPMVRLGLAADGFHIVTRAWVVVASLMMGLGVAVFGAGTAGLRSRRVSPLDALRESAVQQRSMGVFRWLGGAACLLLGLVVAASAVGPGPAGPAQLSAGFVAAMLLLAAAALLSPVFIGPLVRLITWPWARTATGQLVREGSLTAVGRLASTAAPVLFTVGFAVLLLGTSGTARAAFGLDAARQMPAATVVAPDGTPGLSEAAVTGLRSTLATRVYLGNRAIDAVGSPDATGLLVQPSTGLTAGAEASVRFADGAVVRLRVAAVRADLDTAIVLPRAVVQLHDPTALTNAVYVASPGPAAVPGGVVLTAQQYADRLQATARSVGDLFLRSMLAVSVGAAALAVANTLLIATAGRRREFTTLRLAGATPGQVAGVAAAEALLSVLIGTLLGAGVALAALDPIRAALANQIRQAVPIVLPWGALLGAPALCAVVAVLVTAVPAGRIAARGLGPAAR
jgi:putative ABC transport system permease protein